MTSAKALNKYELLRLQRIMAPMKNSMTKTVGMMRNSIIATGAVCSILSGSQAAASPSITTTAVDSAAYIAQGVAYAAISGITLSYMMKSFFNTYDYVSNKNILSYSSEKDFNQDSQLWLHEHLASIAPKPALQHQGEEVSLYYVLGNTPAHILGDDSSDSSTSSEQVTPESQTTEVSQLPPSEGGPTHSGSEAESGSQQADVARGREDEQRRLLALVMADPNVSTLANQNLPPVYLNRELIYSGHGDRRTDQTAPPDGENHLELAGGERLSVANLSARIMVLTLNGLPQESTSDDEQSTRNAITRLFNTITSSLSLELLVQNPLMVDLDTSSSFDTSRMVPRVTSFLSQTAAVLGVRSGATPTAAELVALFNGAFRPILSANHVWRADRDNYASFLQSMNRVDLSVPVRNNEYITRSAVSMLIEFSRAYYTDLMVAEHRGGAESLDPPAVVTDIVQWANYGFRPAPLELADSQWARQSRANTPLLAAFAGVHEPELKTIELKKKGESKEQTKEREARNRQAMDETMTQLETLINSLTSSDAESQNQRMHIGDVITTSIFSDLENAVNQLTTDAYIEATPEARNVGRIVPMFLNIVNNINSLKDYLGESGPQGLFYSIPTLSTVDLNRRLQENNYWDELLTVLRDIEVFMDHLEQRSAMAGGEYPPRTFAIRRQQIEEYRQKIEEKRPSSTTDNPSSTGAEASEGQDKPASTEKDASSDTSKSEETQTTNEEQGEGNKDNKDNKEKDKDTKAEVENARPKVKNKNAMPVPSKKEKYGNSTADGTDTGETGSVTNAVGDLGQQTADESHNGGASLMRAESDTSDYGSSSALTPEAPTHQEEPGELAKGEDSGNSPNTIAPDNKDDSTN